MRLTVENVIYFYLFICITLLIFNILYMVREKPLKRRRERKLGRWRKWLAVLLSDGEQHDKMPNTEKMFSRLVKVEELIGFEQAMEEVYTANPDAVWEFFRNNRPLIHRLATAYGKKEAMERAFFAYVIAEFHPPVEEEHDILTEILLGYMENSTVYCRENVLCALYALGNEQAVEHAFAVLNERGWYHHPRLLSDGMANFTGDKGSLARRLWRHRAQWADFLVVATVQFAIGLEENFSDLFLEGLRNEALSVEVRFALIRYFMRHRCPEVKSILLNYMENSDQENGLAIVAASALSRYPGEDTVQTLKKALHSRNWYVRHNAAGSLADLGAISEAMEAVRSSGDRYASEMMIYMAGEKMPVSGEKEDEKEAVTV